LKIIQIISIGYNGGKAIIQKYLNFQEAFLENGIEHHLIILMPHEMNYTFPQNKNIHIVKSHITRKKYLLHRMWVKEIKRISILIKKIEHDYIFIRLDSINKSIYKFIKSNKSKMILDYPTAPIEEYLIHKPYYQKLAIKYNKKAIEHSLFNIVTIPKTAYKKSYLLPNSLLTKRFIKKTSFIKPSLKQETNILLMSSNYGEYEINGYDRIMESLKKFILTKTNHLFKIYVAGNISENAKEFFNKYCSISIQVKFLGFQTIESFNKIINEIDIGVNTIGYHRNKIFTNSTLKTVDFIGWNLPFIISHEDSNLKGDESFIFKIPPNDNLINIQDILTFLEEFNQDNINEINSKSNEINLTNRIQYLIEYLLEKEKTNFLYNSPKF